MKENKFEDIYDVVKLIPKGKVSSYGAIAEYLGSKGGARLVGWAMNALHHRKDVPAHRVVNRKGVLTGKNAFETPSTMQQLLEKEGLTIKEDQIQNFEAHYWEPVKELL
ncbi:MGMT family protein [Jiulongibacter sediminis]|uniref:MGMT family protein n=1 Tax=Jiulongibacter sediminis TaxID=1605367 RepID=UPI0026F27C63|nr:MGMT family protein [Jiulongibacter sediminis]